MRKFSLSAVAAAMLLIAASQARADVVKLDSFTYANPVTLTMATPSHSGQSGQFSGTLNGNSFVTFCTDLLQSFYFGQTYTDYSVVSGLTAFGAATSQKLDHLVSAFMASGYPNNAVSSATAQAMIWEVLYETGPNSDLGSGSFQVTSANGQAQAALSAIDAMKWSAIDATPAAFHVDRLFSPTAQDFLVISVASVPEPSSIALVAAALVGMGAVGRRARKSKQG